MKDFLVGTLGKLLQVIFTLAGLVLLLGGCTQGSGGYLIGGIVLLCAAFGARYALGHIVRGR